MPQDQPRVKHETLTRQHQDAIRSGRRSKHFQRVLLSLLSVIVLSTLLLVFRKYGSTLLMPLFVERDKALVAFGIALLVVALWAIPKWHCRQFRHLNAELRFDKENESRKTLAQVIGGVLVILSLLATEQAFRLSQEGQFSDRYTKALSLLGEAQPAMRLGGIFALERLARQSTEDDSAMVDVLAAYVRLYAPWPPAKTVQRRDAEVITILRILGRRSESQRSRETTVLNLSDTDLRGLVLDNLDFRTINFHSAHLEGSTMRNTLLSGSFLLGAHLERALVASWDLSQEQIDDACGDSQTVLPVGKMKPVGWLKNPPDCRNGDQ